jgi:hypothetical protein
VSESTPLRTERLELLELRDSGKKLEDDLHDRFARYAIGGAWFRLAGWLARSIERQWKV